MYWIILTILSAFLVYQLFGILRKWKHDGSGIKPIHSFVENMDDSSYGTGMHNICVSGYCEYESPQSGSGLTIPEPPKGKTLWE